MQNKFIRGPQDSGGVALIACGPIVLHVHVPCHATCTCCHVTCTCMPHTRHIHNVHVPLSAFLCSAYKNICCIFCTCSGVKELVNTVYHCWSCWERAGRGGKRERERERATLSFPIIDQTRALVHLTILVPCIHMYTCAPHKHKTIIKKEKPHSTKYTCQYHVHVHAVADLGGFRRFRPSPPFGWTKY